MPACLVSFPSPEHSSSLAPLYLITLLTHFFPPFPPFPPFPLSQRLDNVLQRELSGRRDSSHLIEALQKRRIFGVRFAEVSEHDVNVFMGLQHEDSTVRVAAVNKIFESLQDLDAISQRDQEFLTSNLFTCLSEDGDVGVRAAILSQLRLLLPFLPFNTCLQACVDALMGACQEGEVTLATAAASALCSDLVAHASSHKGAAKDKGKQQLAALSTVFLNQVLPALVFRPHRVALSLAVVREVARSSAASLFPPAAGIAAALDTLERAAEKQSESSTTITTSSTAGLLSTLNAALFLSMAPASDEDIVLLVNTPANTHAAMFVRLRLIAFALARGNSLAAATQTTALHFALDALAGYMLGTAALSADDVRRVMQRARVGAGDAVCDAVLPHLMQDLADTPSAWVTEQRALIAVFAAASLADVAAATRLSNPAAAKQQDAAVVKALQCAAAAPVPQLAQPALRHLLPTDTALAKASLVSRVAFEASTSPQASAACLFILSHVVQDSASALAAVPPALVACTHAATSVRLAALATLSACAPHLSASSKGDSSKEEAEAAALLAHVLQSRDDIASDPANMLHIFAAGLEADKANAVSTSSKKKRAKKGSSGASSATVALLTHILAWADAHSPSALVLAAQLLRDCDTPARAKVVLEQLTKLTTATIPSLSQPRDTNEEPHSKHAGKVGNGISSAVTALKLFAAMLTPIAVEALQSDAVQQPKLRALLETLLQPAKPVGGAAAAAAAAAAAGAAITEGSKPHTKPKRRTSRAQRRAAQATHAAPLVDALKGQRTSGHAVASLGVLKPSVFAKLHRELQAMLLERLVELSLTNTVAHDAVRATLAAVPLHADLIDTFVRETFAPVSDADAGAGAGGGVAVVRGSKRSKAGRRASNNNDADGDGDGRRDVDTDAANEAGVVAAFARILPVLDVLDTRDLDTVTGVESLLAVLNDVVAFYLSLTGENEQACHSAMHTLLSVLTRIVTRMPPTNATGAGAKPQRGAAAGADSDVPVDVDLVVEVLGESRQSDLQNQALLLLGELARLVPRRVIPCCVPIFAFLRKPYFQPDDDYTLHVLQRTIGAIVPAIRSAAQSRRNELTLLLNLCGVFVDSFYTFPHHRRRDLFAHLVQMLGVREFLHVVVLLLMKKEVLDPRGFEDDLSNQYVAASSRVQRARGTGSQIPSFVLSLCKLMPLEDHMYAVQCVMQALLVIPVVSDSEATRLSAAKNTGGILHAAQELAANVDAEVSATQATKAKRVSSQAAKADDADAADDAKKRNAGSGSVLMVAAAMIAAQEAGPTASTWSLKELQWLVHTLTSGKGVQAKHVRHWRYLLVNQVLRHVASRGVLRQLASLELQFERARARAPALSPAMDTEDEEEHGEDAANQDSAKSSLRERAQALEDKDIPAAILRRERVHALNLRIAELALQLGALFRDQGREAAQVNAEAAAMLAKQKKAAARSLDTKHPAGTADYWRCIRSDASKVIQNAYAVLTLEDFVAVCMRLLATDNASTQQHAVEMIATRVEAIARYRSAVTESELDVVMPMVPVLADLTQRCGEAVLASAAAAAQGESTGAAAESLEHHQHKRQLSKGGKAKGARQIVPGAAVGLSATGLKDDRQLKLVQGAAHAIAVMAARYAAERPDVFVDHAAGVLSMIDISKGARTYAVAATCMASFAVLSSVLGLKLLEHFPPLITKMVVILNTCIVLIEGDHGLPGAAPNTRAMSSEVRSQVLLMLQSCFDLATVCVQQFSVMFSNNVLQQFLVASVHPFMCTRRESPLPEALVGKAIALRSLIAKRVAARHLVEALPGCYRLVQGAYEAGQSTVGELADSLRALLVLLEQSVAASTPETVAKQVPHLFRFFATAMQFRGQLRAHQASAGERARVKMVGRDSDEDEGDEGDEEQAEGEVGHESKKTAGIDKKAKAPQRQHGAVAKGSMDLGPDDDSESNADSDADLDLDDDDGEAGEDDAGVREAILLVESSSISCVCATVLHMSDQSFRPYFLRLVDWASAGLLAQPVGSAGAAGGDARAPSPSRVVAFARLVQELAGRLRHVFVPYFSSLLRTYVRFLRNEGGCLTRLGPDGPDMVQYVCRGLSLCFANDRHGFMTTERFAAVAEALIAQMDVQRFALEVTPTLSRGGDSSDAGAGEESDDVSDDEDEGNEASVAAIAEAQEDYLQRVVEDVIPCIVDLADKSGEEKQVQELVGMIAAKCHDEEAVVRLGAVKVFNALCDRMGEELLTFMDRIVTVLGELIEGALALFALLCCGGGDKGGALVKCKG